MDLYTRKHRGVRGGRICPCCNETSNKAKANQLARRRLLRETKKEISDTILPGGLHFSSESE